MKRIYQHRAIKNLPKQSWPEVMKGSEIGLIVVGLLVLFALVAGGLYLYHTSRFNEHSEGHKTLTMTITNNTSVPYTIVHKGRAYLSRPNETSTLKVDRHDDISAMTDEVKFVHRASNDKATQLHITPDGFRTNLSSSRDVDLVNEAEYPVIFAQKSLKGGVSYLTSSVPPQSASEGHFVGGRSLWQVFHPGTPEVPIAEMRTGSQPISRIAFDGIRLRAY